jgi:hypothetical protein
LAIVLSTILGVAVGTLVGRQVPAVIGVLVWFFILEPLTGLVDHISKFTFGQTAVSVGGGNGGHVLPWAAALAVMIVWTAAFVLAAGLVDRRRDIV